MYFFCHCSRCAANSAARSTVVIPLDFEQKLTNALGQGGVAGDRPTAHPLIGAEHEVARLEGEHHRAARRRALFVGDRGAFNAHTPGATASSRDLDTELRLEIAGSFGI